MDESTRFTRFLEKAKCLTPKTHNTFESRNLTSLAPNSIIVLAATAFRHHFVSSRTMAVVAAHSLVHALLGR